MLKLISGATVGFVIGAIYGVQYSVHIENSKLLKLIAILKLLWKAV